jgi:hypothetical protein
MTQAERDRVAELHAAGKSRAAIARELKRSPSTVGRVADALGLSWDRTATAAATEARQVDLAARRAELAATLLDDAFRLRDRLWAPYVDKVVAGQFAEVVTVRHDLPPAAETRNLITSVAVAIDKHLALVKADADQGGGAEVDRWLAAMTGGG